MSDEHTQTQEQHTLDTRGLLCPLPVIRTQEHIKQLSTGVEFTVLATDPGTQADIPAWCRVHGHELIATIINEEAAPSEYRFTIRVTA